MINTPAVDDALASGQLERLMEESWADRSAKVSVREILVEGVATILFLLVAVPFALPALTGQGFDPALAVLLVALYAVVSRTIRFPIGAGYVVPSYLVLVPMLLLLPPATVPLLAAAGLVLGTLARVAVRRRDGAQVMFAIPDAWHTLGPAAVLVLAGSVHGVALSGVYVAAFLSGCLIDLFVSTVREALERRVAPRLQLRVIGIVWLVDACIAPLGLVIANAAHLDLALLVLLLPFLLLVVLVDQDRSARIEEAQHRLGLIAVERTRLQSAVSRLADAFAAKLDLHALSSVVLSGSVDALDADAGRVVLHTPGGPLIKDSVGADDLAPLLDQAAHRVREDRVVCQFKFKRAGAWAMAAPILLTGGDHGALVVARRDREFRDDERALLVALVERAQEAVSEIVAHDLLREQASTDPLTQLGNRRKLTDDIRERLAKASASEPLVLLLYDLDGFKSYNDTFGHLAGDALLASMGKRLATAVAPAGHAYRLGGDEFCVLLSCSSDTLRDHVAAASSALESRGETFSIGASCGSVVLPHEADNPDYALQLADKRMYSEKHGRFSAARDQTAEVLRHVMRMKQPGLHDHASGVADLAVRIGRRLGMSAEGLDELGRAAELHDVGKVGIPDAILQKPGPLDADEWHFVREHTILGERILSAAPALRPVATIVRASHERWDGGGYPDGLQGKDIPLAARIVAVCDAFESMVTTRCYRTALSESDARAELLREAGRQFDAIVVSAFIDELDAQRPGEMVIQDGHAPRQAAEIASRVAAVLDLA